MNKLEQELKQAAAVLKVPVADVADRVAANVKTLKELTQKGKRAKDAASDDQVSALLALVQEAPADYPVIIGKAAVAEGGALRNLWDVLRARMAAPGPWCWRPKRPTASRCCWRRAPTRRWRRALTPAPSSRPWDLPSGRRRRQAGHGPGGRQGRLRPGCGAGDCPRAHSVMRVLALDIGDARIGVAVSDPGARVASPVAVLPAPEVLGNAKPWKRLLEDWEPELLLCGLPRTMAGEEGPQAQKIRAQAEAVAKAAGLPLQFADERLSSAEAKRSLRESGLSEKEMRGKVDMIAASIFLQAWLDEVSRA